MPTEENKLPDPQEGGRYERNEDGTLKTIHQTKPRDTASYAEEKAKRQAGAAAPAEASPQPAAGGAAFHTNEQE